MLAEQGVSRQSCYYLAIRALMSLERVTEVLALFRSSVELTLDL